MNLTSPSHDPTDFSDQLGQEPLLKHAISHPQSIAAPDVTDRRTLGNLAKAAWDAYYPAPNNNNWYDLDGANWVS